MRLPYTISLRAGPFVCCAWARACAQCLPLRQARHQRSCGRSRRRQSRRCPSGRERAGGESPRHTVWFSERAGVRRCLPPRQACHRRSCGGSRRRRSRRRRTGAGAGKRKGVTPCGLPLTPCGPALRRGPGRACAASQIGVSARPRLSWITRDVPVGISNTINPYLLFQPHGLRFSGLPSRLLFQLSVYLFTAKA